MKIITMKKKERDALQMFILKATNPNVMAAMGLPFGGREYQAAMLIADELRRIGPFDPDVDDWGGRP